MKAATFMIIAGEASGDMLAAELVEAIREEFAAEPAVLSEDYQPLHGSFEPRFFGAGGPRMAAAGVELAFDLTKYSVTGLSAVMRKVFTFRRLLYELVNLAREREPDVIICVDFGAFNSRFTRLVREYVAGRQDWFHDWQPKIVQYVSPQVWASREGRAYTIAENYDLVLSIIPFEKEWYVRKVPQLQVEFVGHPLVDRYQSLTPRSSDGGHRAAASPTILLLPGSRRGELAHHLPVLIEAWSIMRKAIPVAKAVMVLPSEDLIQYAKTFGLPNDWEIRCGGLQEALSLATIAIASTGTVTLECAWFGLPTVAFYKVSWFTYQVGKRMAKVRFMAMPNILAEEEVFPEFIQDAATARNIAEVGVELITNERKRSEVKNKLHGITMKLGSPGASRRAAQGIMRLVRVPEPRQSISVGTG